MQTNLDFSLRSKESSLPTKQFLDLIIHDAPIEEVVVFLDERMVKRHSTHIVTLNPHLFMLGREDSQYKNILKGSDVVFCDGIGIVLASRITRHRIDHRVVGTDLMMGLSGLAAYKGYSVFLLGGRNGAAEHCARALKHHWPSVKICGVYELPWFEDVETLDNVGIVEEINRSKADILFVALGGPKQEQWIGRNKQFLDARIMMGVGASFNLIGGLVRRAPHWVRMAGFEWLFRLCQEPRRLWRRYLIGNPLFLYHVIRERLISNNES